MLSKYYSDFNPTNPINEYPRPNLLRNSYLNLNGCWLFNITKDEIIPNDFPLSIIVPYPVESILSGINKRVAKDDILYYKKDINLDEFINFDKVILHIDSVDQEAQVFINRNLVTFSDNGYFPIIVDIKKYIVERNNEIIIKVKDKLDKNYPYGKQKNKNGGMWYTPISGIWKSVWIEGVNNNYIKQVVIESNIDKNEIEVLIDSSSNEFDIEIYDKDKLIYKDKASNHNIYKIDNLKYWSPESPNLYDVIIKNEFDEIKTYFGYRKFETKDGLFYLNNKPYFIHGLLDQGYYPDGIYTPATYKAYKDDILTMKELGFNTLRKHIKVEPLMYYYYADLYGMIIFQDVVNNGKYSFLIDTVLPTVGFKNLLTNKLKITTKKQKMQFVKTFDKTLSYLKGFPSICYLTIFNEGWGQLKVKDFYKIAKNETNLVIDSTSGWFKDHNYSDVNSLHVYFKKIKLPKKSNKPIIVSEFGGYVYKEINHIYNEFKDYGYKTFTNKEAYHKGIIDLYQFDIINNIKNKLAGCIYTQVSDVEDEINGLITYDREIIKVDKEIMLKIKENIDKEFYHD